MHCPIQNGENAEVLLDYCARKLSPTAAAELEGHMEACPDCRSFSLAQRHVWSALDVWESQPVSQDFDRRLYARIDQFENRSWWQRWTGDCFAWRPALSLGAAACGALAVALVVHNPVSQPVVEPQFQGTKIETVEPEQVERALEDLEMLKQLSPSTNL